MTTSFYARTSLTGGVSGALDNLDGADLNDRDAAIVVSLDGFYFYLLDDNSGAAESTPDIIEPDTNAGDKRWLLRALYAPASATRANLGIGTIATQDASSVNIDGGTIDGVDYIKSGGVGVGDGYILLSSTDGTRRLLFKAADSGNFIRLGSDSNHDFMIIRNNAQKIDVRSASVRFTNTVEPLTDDAIDLGSLAKRWDDVYATNGTIQTSDGACKDEVEETPLGLDFMLALSPKQFKWKDRNVADVVGKNGEVLIPAHQKTFTRKHHGLVAQDVSQVLVDLGVSTNDFAGFIYDAKSDAQGLRYHEFMAPMIKAIQELSVKNDALEVRIAALEK